MSGFIQFNVTCIFCQQTFEIGVDSEDFDRYNKGMHIQNAFPYLSPGERELLISQCCEDCFDKMFEEKD